MADLFKNRVARYSFKSMDWLHLLPVIITLVIVGGLVLACFFIAPVQVFVKDAWNVLTSENRELIKNWVSQFGFWGVAVLLLLFLVQMFAFILPSWFLIIVSVLAYGPILGSVIAMAGITLAATVAYAIGFLLGELTIQKLPGLKSEKKMRIYLHRYGFWLVVIFRLAPFLSNDLISYVAGLTSMSYSRFILASLIGITPLIVLIAFLGETNERLLNGFVVVSVVSIAGFVFYLWWDSRQQKKGYTEERAYRI